jgi:cation diffusion facilitator CzcD-associated flavoprotein CzcO
MPEGAPQFLSRQAVVDYLEAYAAHAGLAPRFGVEVTSIVRVGTGRWSVATGSGECFEAQHVVVATGANRVPFVPTFEGQDTFGGEILHSRAYRQATPFVGRRVLVVGMGNTGAEIALDLIEHGVVAVTLSVRSPVNIVPREFWGRPSQRTALALSRLPPRLGDALSKLLARLTVGDLRRWGLTPSPISPLASMRDHGRTPVIDVGTLAQIRAGTIAVRPGIRRLVGHGAEFVDGSRLDLDVLILATGYRAEVESFFPGAAVPLDGNQLPRAVVGEGDLEGVFFVGFDPRRGGLLRTIARQAVAVGEAIAAASPVRPGRVQAHT